MAQHNRNNWHHIPGIGGIMATGLSRKHLIDVLREENTPSIRLKSVDFGFVKT